MTKLVKLGLASVLSAGALFAGTYNVDASHSNVGFKVKHMMISNVAGKFENFAGSFEYDEKTKTLKSLNGVVKVTSINTSNVKRDNHLKESDFFAANKYPEIKFNLNKVEDDKAYGKLTMRGVTKDVILDVEVNGTIKDPWGNTRTGLVLEGKINRMDYGIKYNSILETGGVAVGEKVRLTVELEGILAK
ncbi:polyisoprenoid-binding protein YceI [Malaciobacter marinus]|jgi:polyisoprenoid-binding protein YceI|uniref:Polyisoprenoid-binding protein YceI n=1 Tax=Malaciobacter marinus TaxID=505249 RepID=A0AB36ZTN5_9BACT|nr:YceI family protein [Malaciobacter marinus]PPK58988.1 polyisoprenoid-binding protein YceI [Malaciobacter marinus]